VKPSFSAGNLTLLTSIKQRYIIFTMTNVIGSEISAGDKVRPLYGELRGLYITLIPKMSSTYETIGESYNSIVDELIKTAGQEYYSKFKVKIYTDQFGNPFTDTDKLRAQLASLLSRLHQEFFSSESSPLSNRPITTSLTFNNNNQNSQQQGQQQQQEQKIELNQMLHIAQEMIQAEYGEEQAKKAGDLIKQIVLNPQNLSIIVTSITGLLAIGKVAFIAALPILAKIFNY
jgi:hypothetical protein